MVKELYLYKVNETESFGVRKSTFDYLFDVSWQRREGKGELENLRETVNNLTNFLADLTSRLQQSGALTEADILYLLPKHHKNKQRSPQVFRTSDDDGPATSDTQRSGWAMGDYLQDGGDLR